MEVIISLKALILIVFAILVSAGLMMVVWRIVRKLVSDEDSEDS